MTANFLIKATREELSKGLGIIRKGKADRSKSMTTSFILDDSLEKNFNLMKKKYKLIDHISELVQLFGTILENEDTNQIELTNEIQQLNVAGKSRSIRIRESTVKQLASLARTLNTNQTQLINYMIAHSIELDRALLEQRISVAHNLMEVWDKALTIIDQELEAARLTLLDTDGIIIFGSESLERLASDHDTYGAFIESCDLDQINIHIKDK